MFGHPIAGETQALGVAGGLQGDGQGIGHGAALAHGHQIEHGQRWKHVLRWRHRGVKGWVQARQRGAMCARSCCRIVRAGVCGQGLGCSSMEAEFMQ